ncbi:MAG: hypothetical protein HQK50_16875 [Oligoflexia bacterium]|nr:hypothetical protein [Oligoflexia bacterium]
MAEKVSNGLLNARAKGVGFGRHTLDVVTSQWGKKINKRSRREDFQNREIVIKELPPIIKTFPTVNAKSAPTLRITNTSGICLEIIDCCSSEIMSWFVRLYQS